MSFGRWARFDHYLVQDGYIRPAPDARFETFDPWGPYEENRGRFGAQVPPYGTFGLDPFQMVPLPVVPIPQPAGVGSVSFPVPDDRSLLGATVYAQSLLIQFPSAHLTNVTADVVLR